MKWRCYVYILGFRVTSEAISSIEIADSLLNHLLTLSGTTGGGIEHLVNVIGWVMDEDSRVEKNLDAI